MGKPKSIKLAQAKGVSSKRSVGAYGSKRGTPDKQVHRTEVRFQQPRVRESMAEARAAEEALEKRIEAERESPSVGPTPGAVWAARKKAEREERERREAEAVRLARQAAEERRRQEKELLEARRREGVGAIFEPWDGDPKPGWTTGQARKMLRQGYTVEHVMRVTGVGYRWLNDIRIGDDHRGFPDAG